MDLEKKVHLQLLEALLPPPPLSNGIKSSVDRLKKLIESLHAASLESTASPGPVLAYISERFSSLQLPGPVVIHPTAHSANTQAVLSHLKNSNPSILHVHSPTYYPVFPHHLRCNESYLPIPSHTESAGLLSALLRDAVSARNPVTIIIIHLDSTCSLLPALPVAHALADRFNCKVHATGPGCLSVFRGIPLSIHSLGLDLGACFGVRGCGFITFGAEDLRDGYGEVALAPAVCVQYILEIFPLEKIRQVLENVVSIVEGLSEVTYRIESMWKVDVLAEGVARISYMGYDAEEIERAAVTGDKSGMLEYLDGVLISADSVLRRHQTPTEYAVRELCELLIRTAREFELARAASSAFIARLRQCEHVEAQACRGAELCFISIVPLGHVPPAGRWRADRDAQEAVMKWTRKLADYEPDEGEVVVRVPEDCNEHKAYVVVLPKLRARMGNGGDDIDMAETCERYAQDLQFDETNARSWGVREAEKLLRGVIAIVDEIVVRSGFRGKDILTEEEGNDPEPDGTVEIMEKMSVKDGNDPGSLGEAQLKDSNAKKHNEATTSSESVGYVDQVEEGRLPESSTDPEDNIEIEPAKDTNPDIEDSARKSRPGLWGLLFGESNSAQTESDEESGNVDGGQLEEDYFRP